MMGGKAEEWGRIWLVQIVILLFSLQSTLGILACPNRMNLAQGEFIPGGSALCSHFSPEAPPPPGQTPAPDTQHDCPICLSFVHNVSIILTTELVLQAPDQGTFLQPQSAAPVVAIIADTLHNRGPPASFSA